ncbi:MAG: hypothetical protein ACRC62_05470 [Microcoleus sp.]
MPCSISSYIRGCFEKTPSDITGDRGTQAGKIKSSKLKTAIELSNFRHQHLGRTKVYTTNLSYCARSDAIGVHQFHPSSNWKIHAETN